MKRIIVLLFAMPIIIFANAQTNGKTVKKTVAVKTVAAKPLFKNLLDSFSYAAGFNVASNMKAQGITNLNSALMQKAINDVYANKSSLLSNEQMNYSLQSQMQIFEGSKMVAVTKAAAPEIARGVAFLNENKKRKEVITLPSGLQYEVLKASEKEIKVKPTLIDTVVVNYIGSFTNGIEFENSYKSGMPATFLVTQVIAGWTEVLQLMNAGDKWKVYIPTELAYNLTPRDPKAIPPGAALVFEMTLEDVKKSSK